MSVLEQNSRRKMLLGQDGNSLVLLLIINAILFAIISFIKIAYQLNGSSVGAFQTDILPWLSVPANATAFISRPWTLLTYMFTQYDVWGFITSMLWLWCYGFILQDLTGNKKLIPIYLYGGLAGSIFFLLTINIFPALRANAAQIPSLIGAGPAIMAVAIATTTLAPRYKIFPLLNGGIPLWILTAIFVLLNFATVGSANIGFAVAQLSAGAIGFVFIWQMKQGNDWSDWMVNLVNRVNNLFYPERKYQQKNEQAKLHYKSPQKPFVKTPHITQQRIDELLDKINQKGYNHLSDDEKEFLKKASREEF